MNLLKPGDTIVLKDGRSMHLLVAFKGNGNSANRLVSALQGEKLFLTNSYAGLREDIAQLNGSFDVIYMFGLDKRLKGDIRLETCALLNGQMIFSRLDVSGLASAFRAQGLHVTLGKQPQLSLCNEAYGHMLQKFHGRAVFFHVPSSRYITNELIEKVSRALCESTTAAHFSD